MGAVIEAARQAGGAPIGTGETYDACKAFCARVGLRPLSGRAFGDLLSELDMYSLVRTRVLSRSRYGRTREIGLGLPEPLVEKSQVARGSMAGGPIIAKTSGSSSRYQSSSCSSKGLAEVGGATVLTELGVVSMITGVLPVVGLAAVVFGAALRARVVRRGAKSTEVPVNP